ncbi:penicillin-binding transpeptidase domain-containing protein [Peptoniphilaceae bacterium SGI.137]|nr:penicillin-binding transpeptidase domain-containing protein [Peptoniphilaceae bacterium]
MKQKSSFIRWVVIAVLIIAAFGFLLWRLYDLTITKGAYFRDLSETKRTKTIQITAPRGNIYDRNGKLLAGTRTSFTVQGYKDSLFALSTSERNQNLQKLVELIEHDGADYLSDFPIGINEFTYVSQSDYFANEDTPTEHVQKLLIENNLLEAWLSRVYIDPENENMKVSPAVRALTAFSMKGSALPITWNADDGFALSFIQNEEYDKLMADGGMNENTTPMALLAQKTAANRNVLSQVLKHPAARLLAYEVLRENNLSEGLELTPYLFTYEEQFRMKKAMLHRSFPAVTMDSTAKEDFVSIVKSIAIDSFLTSMTINNSNAFVIPAEKVINALTSKGVDSNLKYVISSDAQSVSIEYAQTEETQELPLERLKRLALANDVLDTIIADDEFKDLAQKAMFSQGVYPGISISDWVYGLEKSQSDFLKANHLVDAKENKTPDPKNAFQKLQEKEDLQVQGGDIVRLGVLNLIFRVRDQGNYAYTPINLCYELTDKTVAGIEEHIPASTGLVISREPIRYYPYGKAACHVLGYIGRIATDAEIKKYVEEKGYLPNELIGKTGVEESFEDTLHGVNGTENVKIDSTGNRTEIISRTEPQAGNNLYLTIDIDLQVDAEKRIRNNIVAVKYGMDYDSPWGSYAMKASPMANSGAIVAYDPNNGELLTMASYPMFDPNLFVTGISGSDWDAYQTDDLNNPDAPKPLMNLATQTAVQPGSMFKTVVSLAALQNGLRPTDQIKCQGYMVIGNTQFNCLIYTTSKSSHGWLDLAHALGVSCNYFFYELGLGYDPYGAANPGIQVSIDDIEAIGKKLGLDHRSGLEINYPAEAKNSIPSRAAKMELTQSLLRKYLEAELNKYKKEEIFKNQNDIQQDIEVILTWAEQGDSISRGKLIRDLEAMGYQSETPLQGQNAGLADIIKYTYFNQTGWKTADSLNTMIGQGQNAYTPVSFNRVNMILANKGQDYPITLVREIRNTDNSTVVFRQQNNAAKIDIEESYFDAVREGMRLSAENTGPLRNLPMAVGSKSGTAQRGGIDPRTGEPYAPYAWDMAFAPFDAPKICVLGFMPAGETSVNIAGPVRDVIAKYLQVQPTKEFDEKKYDGYETYNPERETMPSKQ